MNILYFVYFVLTIDVFSEAVTHQVNRYTCPNITLKNGKIKKRQRGRFVRFTCNLGYLLAGERHSTCSRGKWDPPAPKCARATCPNKPKPPTNGLIYPSHGGAVLHFFCTGGYVLHGPSDIHCDGKSWSDNSPICLSDGAKPPLFCDFEDTEICGWTHDLNHDFDWRRENFGTPSGSIGTGPSFDHTLGIGKAGHYMYIESSSRNVNDTARLISPLYSSVDSEVCFEFYYHMFGATTGSLRVYLKRKLDPWIFDPKRAIFSKSGNQGDKWYRSFHSLGFVDEDFQIIIEGVRGSSYVSDMAIDDVNIIVNCTGEPDITTTEIAVTGVFPIVDSCENRCGSTEGISNDSFHLTCDCDDDCYDNNRCCPDFFDFCVLATTSATSEDFSTTDLSNDIVIDRESPLVPRKSTTLATQTSNTSKTFETATTIKTSFQNESKTSNLSTTMRISMNSTERSSVIPPRVTDKITNKFNKNMLPPTTKRVTQRTIVPKINVKTTPTTPKIIRKLTTPIVLKKSTSLTSNTVNKPDSPKKPSNKFIPPNVNVRPVTTTRKSNVPIIYIETPPTTPKIIRRTYTIKPSTTTTTAKYLYPIRKPTYPIKEDEENDVIEVSIPKDNDETYFITSPFPEEHNSKEFWSDELEDDFDKPGGKNFRETLKLLTQKEPDTSGYNVMAIVISSVGCVVFVVVGSVLLARYYRFRYPRSRALFSKGVSQSDVRFFSNDENLDFTLDNELYGTT